jgi:uncharacterized protein (TIGR02246 family)
MVPIREALERFVDAFNRNDLDGVMAFFSADALYQPPDGSVHRGRDAIRRAFAPQFHGVYGEMVFDVDDWLIDEPGRKAAIRWVCRHDFTGDKGARIPMPMRWFYRLTLGSRVGWHGTDIFHFTEAGLIAGKYSYSSAKRPLLRRELGAA